MLITLKHIFLLNSQKSAVPGVDRNDLHPVYTALPKDVEEQMAIADFLDRSQSAIQLLSGKIANAIGLLAEYRSALISNTVTGKLDIGGFQREKAAA